MNKFLFFAAPVMAVGLLFSCTSDIESAEEVLGKAESSSSAAQGISSNFEPSSSSVLPSSSSALPSSSSALPSSPSVEPSSSSVLPSSSSALPSSSSVEPSSSSYGGLCAGFVNGTEREHYGRMKEQFCDERDGNKYVYVKIGYQTWLAENLNYNASNSKCYENNDENCVTYGRLYNWNTARNVCPIGWHLPSQAEWNVMTAYVGGANIEGKKLKATSVWNWNSNGNGTDDYGFSALPGGGGYYDYYDDHDLLYFFVGEHGDWLSASESEYYSLGAYSRYMYYDQDDAGWWENDKSTLFPVRCLQD